MSSAMANKRIAVVRGPGGLPGLDVHAGAWLAMDDLGIKPSWVSGCSAGAIVSAFDAAGMAPEDFATILMGLTTDDVVLKRPMWKARAYWLDSIADPAPIVRLLEQYLPDRFESLAIPCEVSATQMLPDRCWPRRLRSGRCLREAVLASMSIAGFWPYAQVGGEMYSDGGTTEPYPLPRDPMNFDFVIVLDPVRRTPFVERDRNVISRLRWNVEQLGAQAAMIMESVPVRNRIWIEMDMGDGSTLKFDHSLIASTRKAVYARLRTELAA